MTLELLGLAVEVFQRPHQVCTGPTKPAARVDKGDTQVSTFSLSSYSVLFLKSTDL